MQFLLKYAEVITSYIVFTKGKTISLTGKRGHIVKWGFGDRAIIKFDEIGKISMPKKVLKKVRCLLK